MRKSSLLVALGLILALPVTVNAQGYHVGFGMAIPGFGGGAGDVWDNTGYSATFGVSQTVWPMLNLRGDLGIDRFPATVPAGISGGNLTGFSAMFSGVFVAQTPLVQPYGMGGLGYISYWVTDLEDEAGNTFSFPAFDDQFLISFGGGLQYALQSGRRIFAEGVHTQNGNQGAFMSVRIGLAWGRSSAARASR